jgi:O-antigen ligase
VLSGSRCMLLALGPIIIVLLLWKWQKGRMKFYAKNRPMPLLGLLLLVLGAFLVSNTGLSDRARLAVSEASDYFIKGDASTSVGLRFEVWNGALLAAREHPILGIGYRQRQSFIESKINRGDLKPEVLIMRHAHSDYFEALQSRGIPGLILQLLLYAVPLMIFLRGLKETQDEKLFAALGGTLMITGYMIYSLTEVPMYNGLPLIFFIIATSLFIGILKHFPSATDADYSR